MGFYARIFPLREKNFKEILRYLLHIFDRCCIIMVTSSAVYKRSVKRLPGSGAGRQKKSLFF